MNRAVLKAYREGSLYFGLYYLGNIVLRTLIDSIFQLGSFKGEKFLCPNQGANMDWFTDGGVSIHKKDYSHIAIVNTEGFQYYEDFHEYYTNNQLEIMAILKCMKEYAKEGDFIFSDSTLCVGGVEGSMKIKKPHLIPLFNEAKKLILEKKLYIEWIPREQNLAGHLLEEKMKKIQGARQ